MTLEEKIVECTKDLRNFNLDPILRRDASQRIIDLQKLLIINLQRRLAVANNVILVLKDEPCPSIPQN